MTAENYDAYTETQHSHLIKEDLLLVNIHRKSDFSLFYHGTYTIHAKGIAEVLAVFSVDAMVLCVCYPHMSLSHI